MSARQSATEELRRQTDAARALLAAYQDILGEDAAARRDAVEGETSLHDAIRAGIARLAEIRALVSGIEAFVEAAKERGDRLLAQDQRIRAALLTALEVGGLPSLETPLGTVSRRAVPPSLVITDEAAIPDDFKVPQPPKIDRRKLLDALKSGDPAYADIPGVELSNGGTTVAIRLT